MENLGRVWSKTGQSLFSERRKALKISQSMAAEQMNVGRKTWQRIESGSFTWEELTKAAEILKLKIVIIPEETLPCISIL